MDYAELAEFIAALILDPQHHCPHGCLCEKVRELEPVRNALKLMQARQALQV